MASGISYEITCATSRIVPRIDHFEFEAQPAMITPTTSMLETDRMKKRPRGRSLATSPRLGSTRVEASP